MSKARNTANISSVTSKTGTGLDVAGTLDVSGATTLDSTLDTGGSVDVTGDISTSGAVEQEGPRACIARRTTDSSNITSGSWQILDFGSSTYNSEGGDFRPAGSGGHFTVPTGVSLIRINAYVILNQANSFYMAAFNGSSTTTPDIIVEAAFENGSVVPVFSMSSGLVSVSAGADIYIKCFTSTANCYIQTSSSLSVEIIG
jgi:hypothetical protein